MISQMDWATDPHGSLLRLHEEVTGWLTRVSYKPGWTFEIVSPGWGAKTVGVRFLFTPPHRDDPTRTVEVGATWALPIYADDFEGFVRWWRDCIRRIEDHEVNEWMLVDGVRRWDPHGSPA